MSVGRGDVPTGGPVLIHRGLHHQQQAGIAKEDYEVGAARGRLAGSSKPPKAYSGYRALCFICFINVRPVSVIREAFALE
jgi:hypothetical protein